ncbi:hypothetical protein HW555_005715 [Spodoptera exigua]|uniref:Uncharacterized protein n=1 Tax=Spodoptera exigua TaxID=7107 RepID=A0A835GFY0_SPOEX|nr:hypothetical protein HW555_005715 [Spodoptera exigua]
MILKDKRYGKYPPEDSQTHFKSRVQDVNKNTLNSHFTCVEELTVAYNVVKCTQSCFVPAVWQGLQAPFCVGLSYMNKHLTIVAPRINFKSNGEIIESSQQSNISSLEVDKETEPSTGEQSLPRTSKTVRKVIEIEHQKQTISRNRYGGNAELRSGNVDNSLEYSVKKESSSDYNAANNNINSQRNDHLNLLHQYPEIIIDHITYDNDEQTNNNNSKLVSPSHESQLASEMPPKPVPRTQHNNLEENTETANYAPSEHSGTNHNLTSEIKNLIDTIIQKKITHIPVLRQDTTNETRKQSKILEKILQKIPEMKLVGRRGKANYLRQRELVQPPQIDKFSRFGNPADNLIHRNVGNSFIKSYLHAPHVINKWEIHSRLLKTLLLTCRPNGLNHIRLIAELIDRIISNIGYRSACYDLFK